MGCTASNDAKAPHPPPAVPQGPAPVPARRAPEPTPRPEALFKKEAQRDASPPRKHATPPAPRASTPDPSPVTAPAPLRKAAPEAPPPPHVASERTPVRHSASPARDARSPTPAPAPASAASSGSPHVACTPGMTPETPDIHTPPEEGTELSPAESRDQSQGFDVTRVGFHGALTPAATTDMSEDGAMAAETLGPLATTAVRSARSASSPPSPGEVAPPWLEDVDGEGDVDVTPPGLPRQVEPLTPSPVHVEQRFGEEATPAPRAQENTGDSDESPYASAPLAHDNESPYASPPLAHDDESPYASPPLAHDDESPYAVPLVDEALLSTVSLSAVYRTSVDGFIRQRPPQPHPQNPAPARDSESPTHAARVRASCLNPPETFAASPPSSHTAEELCLTTSPVSPCPTVPLVRGSASTGTVSVREEVRGVAAQYNMARRGEMGGVSQVLQLDGEAIFSGDDGDWLVRPGDSPGAALLEPSRQRRAVPVPSPAGRRASLLGTPRRPTLSAQMSMERVKREADETEDFLRIEQGILEAEVSASRHASSPPPKGTAIVVSPGPADDKYSPGVSGTHPSSEAAQSCDEDDATTTPGSSVPAASSLPAHPQGLAPAQQKPFSHRPTRVSCDPRQSEGFEPMPPAPRPTPQDATSLRAEAWGGEARLAASSVRQDGVREAPSVLSAGVDVVDDVSAFVTRGLPVVDLRMKRFRDPTAGTAALFSALGRCKAVLRAFHAGVDTFDGEALLTHLTACRSLEVIDLTRCAFRDATALVQALRSGMFPCLRTLILSHTGLTAGSIGDLFQAASACPTLKSLDVRGNALGNAGLQAMLRETQVNNTLDTLDLCDVGMTGKAVQTIGMLLRRLRRVSRLSLAHNVLGSEGSSLLAAVLLAAPSVRVVVLEGCGVDDAGLRRVVARPTTIVVSTRVAGIPAATPGKLMLCVHDNPLMITAHTGASVSKGAGGSVASPLTKLGSMLGMKGVRNRDRV
eukprot:TRINITY_DN3171_c0_g1_i3.p1 TRINITY_DN3171_c0_g1~~TRINITY_DN3171_c0_g1_i3.p1  ORF type:complete len:981 (+),score=123.67 TRINITY_DN3171_c0_g1_i3:57-2999(+)